MSELTVRTDIIHELSMKIAGTINEYLEEKEPSNAEVILALDMVSYGVLLGFVNQMGEDDGGQNGNSETASR